MSFIYAGIKNLKISSSTDSAGTGTGIEAEAEAAAQTTGNQILHPSDSVRFMKLEWAERSLAGLAVKFPFLLAFIAICLFTATHLSFPLQHWLALGEEFRDFPEEVA